MHTSFKLSAEELNHDFIISIKELFKNKQIEIIVREMEDETEYLLKDQANKNHLLKAIEDVDNNNNLINTGL